MSWTSEQTLLAPSFEAITTFEKISSLLHVHVPWFVLVLCASRREEGSVGERQGIWPSSCGIELLENEEGQKAL